MMEFFNFLFVFFEKNGFLFELIICNFMFVFTLKKRDRFVLRLFLSIFLLAVATIIWGLFDTRYTFWDIPKYLMLTAMALFGIMFCYKVKLSTALFCEIGAFAIQHCAFKVSELFLSFTHRHEILYLGELAYLIALPAMYFALFFLFARRLKKYDITNFHNNEIILLSVAIMIIAIFLGQYDYRSDYSIYILLAVYDVLCCLLTLSMLFSILKSATMTREVQMMEQLLFLQKKQMQASKETMDTINIKCHDLKHQLSALEGRVSTEELKELKDAITIYDLSVKTGHEALDIILAEKKLKCWKNNIRLNCIADGKSLSFMRSSDIYSLFGNAIENAIDAVQKLENHDRRVIGIVVKNTMGMVSVHIENFFGGSLNFTDDDLPISTKKDKRYHGYGVKSIKMLAEKYNGYISIKTNENVFELNIILPVKA